MKQITQFFGKFFYAFTFLVLIPAILWFWAKYTQDIVTFPILESRSIGGSLIVAGGLLMFWAMFVLMRSGKGLPMNAYPPTKFVTNGPYRILKHPIYWGFGLIIVGCSIFFGSASGLWLVSPITILGMITLVLGYEEIDLRERFPDRNVKTILDFPDKQESTPSLRDRFTSLFLIFCFLMLNNFMLIKLTGSTTPWFEDPIITDSSFLNPYITIVGLIFVFSIPFFLRRKELLREWALTGALSLCIALIIGVLLPAFGAQYLLNHNLALYTVPIYLILISLKAIFSQSWKAGIVFSIIGAVIGIFQLIYSPSFILYFTESIIVFLLASFYHRIWEVLRNLSEIIANSWKEWIFGKVRVINHGFYIGIGAFFGVLLAGILAGKEYAIALLVFSFLVTVCAALWAQIIEGSEKLKRPFGYYGGLVGIIFGSIAVWAMGYDGWVIIGVVSVVMPWVQAIGRLRCLVNGCCHGSRTDNPVIGIRYSHFRSRVCTISGLKGELLHPTQLYSILWLLVVGFILLSLWINNLSYPFIFGIYLILTGLGRFVEEAYRGEAQTPNVFGLHLYQWTAIISVIIGIIMTVIQVEPSVINPGFSWQTLIVAALSGFFLFFAMGVDFPYSNRRFSRLV